MHFDNTGCRLKLITNIQICNNILMFNNTMISNMADISSIRLSGSRLFPTKFERSVSEINPNSNFTAVGAEQTFKFEFTFVG